MTSSYFTFFNFEKNILIFDCVVGGSQETDGQNTERWYGGGGGQGWHGTVTIPIINLVRLALAHSRRRAIWHLVLQS